MERNTLSNYGWIIICALVLSVMLAFASPFGRYVGEGIVSITNGFRTANDSSLEKENIEQLEAEWSDKLNDPDKNYNSSSPKKQLEELQEQYAFSYYNTLHTAVDDVNNNTVGQNADATKSSAKVGIYENNGEKYVVLLKDITIDERVILDADMTLNLGGNTIKSNNFLAIDIAKKATIDGSMKGSSIEINDDTMTDKVRLVQVRPNAELIVNGGAYIVNTPNSTQATACFSGGGNLKVSKITATVTTQTGIGKTIRVSGIVDIADSELSVSSDSANSYTVGVTSTTTIKNSKIISNNNNQATYCIYVSEGASMTIEDSEILSTSSNNTATAIQIDENCVFNISNCKVLAKTSPESDNASAIGMMNYGTTTATDCEFIANSNYNGDNGTYDALSIGVWNVKGTLTINNCYVFGTHSGMQTSATVYVDGGTFKSIGHGGIYFCGKNTTSYVKNATCSDAEMPEGYSATCGATYAGIYIGGNTTNENIVVYMDNCHLYGNTKSIVLRGTSGEQNNSLYISNSIINETNIRIDNNTHRLYIGENCEISENQIYSNTNETINTDEVIVYTNQNYAY